MVTRWLPQLQILSPAQRRVWDALAGLPGDFLLCGGTAVALHLGHRTSVDFDFFGTTPFDPGELCESLPLAVSASIVQQAPNTLTLLVDREGVVKISFFGTANIKRLEPVAVANDNGIKVASLLQLAGMKAVAVQRRAEAKDYIDIAAILADGRVDLPHALAAASLIFGPQFRPELTLKSLSYFGDGNLSSLTRSTMDFLAEAVRKVEITDLPDLTQE